MIPRLRALLRNLRHRQARDRDLGAEVDSYLALLVAEKIEAGMAPDAALRAARLELGAREAVKEEVRDVRAGASLERWARDIRIGLRSLRRSPGFALFTLATFAIAIGGITLIASLVNAVLIRPLPYPDSDRLVMVLEASAGKQTGGFAVAAPNYEDWERRNRVLERMALYEYQGYNLSGNGEPEQVGGLRTTSGLFAVLGVAPALGRVLVPDDDVGRNGPVVVLSHRLWQGRYGGDSTLVGRSIRVNKTPHVVIGVMPQGFAFPSVGQQLWVPIALNAEDRSRGAHSFWAIGRLRDGISIEQAKAEIRSIGDQLATEFPATNAGETANLFPMRDLWLSDVASTLRILMFAVALVALIAAANVASLLVARGISRRRELAARLALGGTRARVAGQLVVESALLALLGGGIGLALAAATLPAITAALPRVLQTLPFRDLSQTSLDPGVIAVALLIALAVGVVTGLIPALVVMPGGPGEVLRDAGTRAATASHGHHLRNVLLAADAADRECPASARCRSGARCSRCRGDGAGTAAGGLLRPSRTPATLP
jgi:putative ABC transport system permease protein